MSNQAAVELAGVRKTYGEAVALDHVDLAVRRGRWRSTGISATWPVMHLAARREPGQRLRHGEPALRALEKVTGRLHNARSVYVSSRFDEDFIRSIQIQDRRSVTTF